MSVFSTARVIIIVSTWIVRIKEMVRRKHWEQCLKLTKRSMKFLIDILSLSVIERSRNTNTVSWNTWFTKARSKGPWVQQSSGTRTSFNVRTVTRWNTEDSGLINIQYVFTGHDHIRGWLSRSTGQINIWTQIVNKINFYLSPQFIPLKIIICYLLKPLPKSYSDCLPRWTWGAYD